jgi:uncharacterized repeat protein (TIGR03847 family)
MPNIEIELNPVDFITINTVGPKGKRVFHLQAGQEEQVVSLVIEKEQAWALSEAIQELLDDLNERYEDKTSADLSLFDMELRDPVKPLFRVAQMGLGYDEDNNMVVLVIQELLPTQLDDEAFGDLDMAEQDPGIVRLWCSREQVMALSSQAMDVVKSGRADPKQNGRLIYYWT